jgi:hypothetical protein
MPGIVRPESLKSMHPCRLCKANTPINGNQVQVEEVSYKSWQKYGTVGGSSFKKTQQRFHIEDGKGNEGMQDRC